MRNGRINERNIGHSRLDGGAKGAKYCEPKQLNEEEKLEKKARLILECMNTLLSDKGIKLHKDYPCDIIQHWIDNNIVIVKDIENPNKMQSIISPIVTMAFLNEEKKNDLLFVKMVICETYNLPEDYHMSIING